jgi:2-dehydropantoate 2-reductase
MRHVIFGPGAIGGTIAARLAHAGHDVAVIARGAHGTAIAERGLTLRSPDDVITVPVPVAAAPDELDWRPDDVVYLAMKSQDTVPAVKALVAAAPPGITIVCAQNGVQNERMVLRRFAHVQGMCVMCPAAHLEPGEILVYCAPVPAILEVGRYPSGTDATTEAIAADLVSAGFLSRSLADIMRWKHRKLLLNLGNAAQALSSRTTDDPDVGALAAAARQEARQVYAAAGIDAVSSAEDEARRADHLTVRPIEGQPYGGWSTWQSLRRGTGSVEVDYLNGEIVLQGRLHGVPTPINETLQRLTNDAARRGDQPGGWLAADLLAVATEAATTGSAEG